MVLVAGVGERARATKDTQSCGKLTFFFYGLLPSLEAPARGLKQEEVTRVSSPTKYLKRTHSNLVPSLPFLTARVRSLRAP